MNKYTGVALEKLLPLATAFQSQVEIFGGEDRAGRGFTTQHDYAQRELDEIWLELLENHFEIIRGSLKLVGKGPQPFQDRNAKLVFAQGQNKFQMMVWVLRKNPDQYTKVRNKMEKELTMKAHKVWVDGEGYGLLNKAYGPGAGYYAVVQMIGKFHLPVMSMLSVDRFTELTGQPIAVLDGEKVGPFAYEFEIPAAEYEKRFPASAGSAETDTRERTIRLRHNIVQFDVFVHGVQH